MSNRSSEERDRNKEHEDGEHRHSDEKDRAGLHIKNLHPRTAEEDIKDALSKYGEVTACSVIRDPHTQESRCFGFATMSTVEEAEEVIRQLDATSLDGRTISIQKSRRTAPRQPTPGSYRGLKSHEELRRRDDFRFQPTRPHEYPSHYSSDRFSRAPLNQTSSYNYPPAPRIDRYIERGRYESRGYERDRVNDRGYERDRDRGYDRDRGNDRR